MTVMDMRAQLERGWAQGYGPRLPGVVDAVEDHLRNVAAIDGGDYRLTDAARSRQIEACRAQFEARYRDAVEAACLGVTKPIDDEMTELREQDDRDLRNPATVAREMKAARLSKQVSEAVDGAGIAQALDEAMLGGDDVVTRAVWSAGRKRHAELREAARFIPSRSESAIAASHTWQLTAAQWESEHPTPARRLRDLGVKRQNAVDEVVRQAAYVRQMFGIRG